MTPICIWEIWVAAAADTLKLAGYMECDANATNDDALAAAQQLLDKHPPAPFVHAVVCTDRTLLR